MMGCNTYGGRLIRTDRSEAKTLDLGGKGLAATKKETPDNLSDVSFFYADDGT